MVGNGCEAECTSVCFCKCIFKCIVKLLIFHHSNKHFEQEECYISPSILHSYLTICCCFFLACHSLSLSLALFPQIYLHKSSRKQTWPWQVSPSHQKERKLSTFLSRSWPWGSASCTEFNWWGCYLGLCTHWLILATDLVLDFISFTFTALLPTGSYRERQLALVKMKLKESYLRSWWLYVCSILQAASTKSTLKFIGIIHIAQ